VSDSNDFWERVGCGSLLYLIWRYLFGEGCGCLLSAAAFVVGAVVVIAWWLQ
jgi:hypothetical protein